MGVCLLLSGAAIWCPVLFCALLYASSHQPSNAQVRQKPVPQVVPPHLWEIRMLYAWSSLLFSSPGKTWGPGVPSWSPGANVMRGATNFLPASLKLVLFSLGMQGSFKCASGFLKKWVNPYIAVKSVFLYKEEGSGFFYSAILLSSFKSYFWICSH